VYANYFALSHHATKIKIKNNDLYFFYFHIDRRILDNAINTLPRDISINEDTCRKQGFPLFHFSLSPTGKQKNGIASYRFCNYWQ